MQLTSKKNPRLQAVKRALAKGRMTEEGFIVVEGPHLLQEALKSEWSVQQIFITSEARQRYVTYLMDANVHVVELSPRAMAGIAATQTTQEVLTVLRPRKWSWNDLLRPSSFILALDGVSDPGNAGTIIRSAEAFGASGVLFLRGSVRVSNGKFTRATAGSIFRVPFLEDVETAELIARSRPMNLPIYTLMPEGAMNLSQLRLRGGCVLVVGNEGAGVSRELHAASIPITIPTQKVESLNAAVACSIALYAIGQQRKTE